MLTFPEIFLNCHLALCLLHVECRLRCRGWAKALDLALLAISKVIRRNLDLAKQIDEVLHSIRLRSVLEHCVAKTGLGNEERASAGIYIDHESLRDWTERCEESMQDFSNICVREASLLALVRTKVVCFTSTAVNGCTRGMRCQYEMECSEDRERVVARILTAEEAESD